MFAAFISDLNMKKKHISALCFPPAAVKRLNFSLYSARFLLLCFLLGAFIQSKWRRDNQRASCHFKAILFNESHKDEQLKCTCGPHLESSHKNHIEVKQGQVKKFTGENSSCSHGNAHSILWSLFKKSLKLESRENTVNAPGAAGLNPWLASQTSKKESVTGLLSHNSVSWFPQSGKGGWEREPDPELLLWALCGQLLPGTELWSSRK